MVNIDGAGYDAAFTSASSPYRLSIFNGQGRELISARGRQSSPAEAGRYDQAATLSISMADGGGRLIKLYDFAFACSGLNFDQRWVLLICGSGDSLLYPEINDA